MRRSCEVSTVCRVLTGRVFRRVFRPLMKGRTPIFMLHRKESKRWGIGGHSPEFIRAALGSLRESGAKFVSLRTLVDAWRSGAQVDPECVVFTIDDGFADQADLVRDVFAPLECPVTIFLITGFVDGRLWPWDDQITYAFENATMPRLDISVGAKQFRFDLTSSEKRKLGRDTLRDYCKVASGVDPYSLVSELAHILGTQVPVEPPEAFRPMTWDTVRELERLGAEFGPHSVSHRIFARMSDSDAQTEIATSWARIKEELVNPLPVFAWPTGKRVHYSGRDIDIARNVGLHAGVGTVADYAHYRDGAPPAAIFEMNRYSLPNDLFTAMRYGTYLERFRQVLPI